MLLVEQKLPWVESIMAVQLLDSISLIKNYFDSDIVKARPPASGLVIARFEESLGVQVPTSMREFLLMHNGLCIEGVMEWFGVSDDGSAVRSVIDQTARWSEILSRASLRIEQSRSGLAAMAAQKIISVAEPNTGDSYLLLCGATNGGLGYPVAVIDHESARLSIVASSFERFCSFEVGKLMRWYSPDGEFVEDTDPHVEKEWAKHWALQNDPEIFGWRDF
jgi:hypothetical protein